MNGVPRNDRNIVTVNGVPMIYVLEDGANAINERLCVVSGLLFGSEGPGAACTVPRATRDNGPETLLHVSVRPDARRPTGRRLNCYIDK